MSSKSAERKAAAAERKAAKAAKKNGSVAAPTTVLNNMMKNAAIDESEGRSATGTLVSEERARDIKIDQFSLSLHGTRLIEDTVLELHHGKRYGLLGRNGSGKSTMMKCLAAREIPIPEIFDIYLLAHEAPPSEQTALEYVINSAKDEVARIEALIEHILVTSGPEAEELNDLYDRQDALDPSTFESRASIILCGLGFTPEEIPGAGGAHLGKKTKDMSGGWRMRVSLSRALFLAPSILLLDEPTNHVCTWRL